ncbi:hypothetical protein QF035_009015 [Streptomyces umbrinus]|uniref:Secreted protein n=1 Tax=Streptomyces umbrinus TaxID=67370 RepID=A0ABU0T6V6_9ACTN|nr:hypothetical protein [Streptomyces umbrinus]MDQ1031433.1 hypothetical protein [Streptomyces umbrinus]
MDPAIIAAVITTPTAVIAAAAAYAAGRAQARAAHHGPIDAVRRQHQRDAYAALTRAAWSYLGSAGLVKHLVEQVNRARLNDRELTPEARARLWGMWDRTSLSRDDVADVLAPADIPPAIGRALRWLERVSPTWRQDIHDANKIDDVAHAESVVALEGPDHLAELAERIRRQAVSVQHCWATAAFTPFKPLLRQEMECEVPLDKMLADLKESIQAFTQAARAHLNTH